MGSTSPPRSVAITVVLACAVAVCAQVGAALLGSDGARSPRPVPVPTGCGDEPCRVLASTVVNGMPVELLADRAGTTGKLRAGDPVSGTVTETRLTSKGVLLNHNSLRCAASATPVCLVRGPRGGGMLGEIHVWRGHGWGPAGRTFFSDAGMVVLDDVVANAIPEVVVVRHDCAEVADDRGCRRAPVLAEVLRLGGSRAGCTSPRESPGDLPGWPEVDVRGSELGPCPPAIVSGHGDGG